MIYHGDRRAQYASRRFADWSNGRSARLSVGLSGPCRDNAVAESFSASPRNEMCHLKSWPTRQEAKLATIECIESCCNRGRPRSATGYRIPAQVMGGFMERFDRSFAGLSGEAMLAA